MFKTTVAAGALAFLGTVMMMPVTTGQVAATPLTLMNPLLPDVQTANPNVQQVAVKRKWRYKRGYGNRWRGGRHYGWNRSYHGSRYRYRYGRYRHYHDGYYYASPWWLLAPFAIGAVTAPYYYGGYGGYNSGYGRHDRWCLNRYRSYNPRTNTYVGYDGYRHRCRSPYGY